jgi:hypothetical protein
MTNATRPATTFVPRRALTAVLLAACTILLAGCSWFEPPEDVSAEAQELGAQIRTINGVTEVDVEVHSRDAKDHPSDWIFVFTIDTANSSSLGLVPSGVRAITEKASVYGISVSLDIPASQGIAPVVLRNLSDTAVQAAIELRTLPEVAAVDIGAFSPGITVVKSDDASLAETAVSLRTVTGFGADEPLSAYDPLTECSPLHTITVQWDGYRENSRHSVEVGSTGPSLPVLDALDQLGGDPTINRIYVVEDDMWGLSSGRPAIDIEVDRPASVVTLLSETADPAADAGIRPRTAFRVTTGTTTSDTEPDGYVGLPLGSEEPQDLPAPPVQPEPRTPIPAVVDAPPAEWVPSTDPVVLAQLDTLTVDVENFLHNAESISGVTAEFSTNIGPCETPDGGSIVTAYVVLPIFDVADSANDAFAAIVGDWERSGLNRADRALGLDIYSNPSDAAAIAQATIRGTTEGINIRVTSRCVENPAGGQ